MFPSSVFWGLLTDRLTNYATGSCLVVLLCFTSMMRFLCLRVGLAGAEAITWLIDIDMQGQKSPCSKRSAIVEAVQ
jgi:hypothetical protein